MTDVKINLSQPILNNLLQHSGAIALIVISGDKVEATAGSLSDSGVQVLVLALQRYWPAPIARDLTRYVGLSIDDDDRFFSVKFLPEGDYCLGLVFPLQTSLSQIRQDLANLVQDMLDQDQAKNEAQVGLDQSLQFLLKDYPVPDPDHPKGEIAPTGLAKLEKPPEQIKGAVFQEDQTAQRENQTRMDEEATRPFSYSETPTGDELNSREEAAEEIDLGMEDIPWQSLEDLMPPEEEIAADRNVDTPLEEEQPETTAQKSAWQTLDEQEQEEHDLVSILQEDFTSVQDLTPADDIVLPLEDLPDPLAVDLSESEDEDESEASIVDEAEAAEWEPVIADITFYLVPRLKRHFLVKELPHGLRRWIPEICETYGWQLDALSVRPDYLKWTLRDFPESLVRKMLRIIRRETSQRIFGEFPNLQHGNPTEDFWSQSYLVDRENLEISTQALIAHVAKERLIGRKAA